MKLMTPVILEQINQIKNYNIVAMYDCAAVWQVAHNRHMTELADYIENNEAAYFYFVNHGEEPEMTSPMSEERIMSVADLYGENAQDLIQFVREEEAAGRRVDEAYLIYHIREVTLYWKKVCIEKIFASTTGKEPVLP